MMKIKVEKKMLANAVSNVLKAVPGKTTMQILNNILITAIGSEIVLVGNDLELGISSSVEGEIVEQGKTTIDARLFSEIVRKLPDGEVSLSVDEKGTATVKCGKSKKGSVLRVTALDGHRIGIRNIELAEEYPDIKAIMPGKTMAELAKIITGGIDDKVTLLFGKNHVVFRFGNTVVTSRLIEGNYFGVDKLIGGDTPIHFMANRKDLIATIDRTLTLVAGENRPVIFDKKGKNLSLSIKTARGEMTEEMEIETSGDDIRIAFNPKFVIDTLKAVEDEKVDFYLASNMAPAFVKNEKGEYLYLILPVNIRE